MQNFRALQAPPLHPQNRPPPLQIPGYAPDYFRACMQNILLFLVIFRARCSILWPFIQNLRNNYQITEKNQQT